MSSGVDSSPSSESSTAADTMLDLTRKMMLSYLPGFNDAITGDHHTLQSNHIEWLTANATPMSTDWSQFPGLPFAFSFERNFSREHARSWMYNNWHISLAFSAAYITLVTLGQRWMSNRKAFHLRSPMVLWSTMLAIFSIVGTMKCLPEFIQVIYKDGLYASYCSSSYYYDVRLTFWYWIFTWSKVAELGDTAFIVLRKQKLSLLHWIHHALTLTYAFYVIGDIPGTARWMVNMNFLIHSFMYTYYAFKAMRINISRSIAMLITIGQITQMMFGLYVNYYSLKFKLTGSSPCDLSFGTAAAGFAIYSLFFVLFINFFLNAYLKNVLVKVWKMTQGTKTANKNINGNANGNANGKANGKANGATNGNVNGNLNGKANGKAINGNGTFSSHNGTNGTSNGKSNGVSNGVKKNGHTNGNCNGYTTATEIELNGAKKDN